MEALDTCDEVELLDVDVVDKDDGGPDHLSELDDGFAGSGLEHPDTWDDTECCEDDDLVEEKIDS